MDAKLIRVLFWSGCLAGLIFFVGDMAFCFSPGSGRSFTPERVFNLLARVPQWRIQAGAVAGPVGLWFELLAMFGLAMSCKPAAPRAALLMMASLYTFEVFSLAAHSHYAPIAFVLRSCGSDGDAVRYILRLSMVLTAISLAFATVGAAIWAMLTLKGASGVPRWTVLLCPLVSYWLCYPLMYAPGPVGFSLVAGWRSLAEMVFFAVLALTYRPVKGYRPMFELHRSALSRRRFLAGSAGALALAANPWRFAQGATLTSGRDDRRRVGCIGLGDRWEIVGVEAMKFGDVVAVCDVDRKRLEVGQEKCQRTQGFAPDAYEDYRQLLDRQDIDAVVIVTPDHWHTKISIDAMRAGKDVYCEKPLTLTIDEGKQICRVVDETQRVFQVGTTQRSEIRSEFINAVALVRAGRLGKIHRVTCIIGHSETCEPLHKMPVPAELNWNLWLGQAPMTDFLGGGHSTNKYPCGRSHFHFRWWYEYSGGKMTDWGAHHVDITHWALGADDTGPLSVEGTAEFPVPLVDGMPTESNRYNTATTFAITAQFAGGVEVKILSDKNKSILFEGDKGRILVRRGGLSGKPVEQMVDDPLPAGLISELYKGKTPGNHMRNFFECVADRGQPVSDVYSHHRAVSTCHLANIAIRLGRKIEWDPVAQQIVGDEQANSFLSRPQRKGFEIEA